MTIELSNAQGAGVTEVTPNASGVAPVTPTQPLPDVQSDSKLQELERKLQEREQDINKLKSSLQRNQEQERKQWEAERKRLEDEVRNNKMSSMTEDQKQQYQRERELEEAQVYKKRVQELEQTIEQREIAANYIEYFESVGVPAEKIVVDKGIEELVNSGWQGLGEVMKLKDAKIRELEARMSAPLDNLQQPQQTQRTPITNQQISTSPGLSYEDIAKKYGGGDLNKVFERLERGELDPSILPKE